MPVQKAYFLLPNTDIAPETLIKLGQIVPSIREPQRPFCSTQPAPKNTYTSTKTNYKFDKAKSNAVSAGLMAQFLAQLGSPVSGGISIDTKHSLSNGWKFDRLETHYFEPDDAYINAVVRDDAVKRVLSKSKLASVYIITGLKIACGASCQRSEQRNTATALMLATDATAMTGVPMAAGAEVGVRVATAETESWGSCSDFVWAVRYRRVRLSFFSNRVVAEDVFGGELVSHNPGMISSSESSEEEEEPERELNGADVEDGDVGLGFTPRGFRKEVVVDEEGEECAALS
ncbi:hypothetical protein BU23DRAFT_603062 [Bimuria novae-zelandiae CBS 107.79]|uniref:Uncharacterized protein n=1 Tax=Bimuria novae-zelandiae CBS 107.79 TaxID=1447943 RepID=A0A6A5URY5_9PLEO|nr:hypothetical protein BU23DRAFT_603062 [Bimuria novae-zelandiae CBS 107.79]